MKNHSNWLGFDVKILKEEFREDERSLKQVSHKKPFKKLFLGDSRLGESGGSVAKIFASREWVASKPRVASFSRENFRESRVSRQKLLDELATGVSRLASRQLSREKLWHLFFNTEHG